LLSHTAGLGDRDSGTGSHDDEALGATIRALDASILELPPSAIYSYSSLGYWTAGFLIESIAGKPFAEAVDERVFTPVGMTGSTFRPLMAMTYPHAQQHAGGRGVAPTVIRPFADQASSWPGGSAFASIRGLARFMMAFLNGGQLEGKRVLPEKAINLMSKGQAPIPGSNTTFYTYGLVLDEDRGIRTLSHGGARIGFGSRIVMAPDQNVGVAVMGNRSNAMLAGVAHRALEMLVKFEPPEKELDATSVKLSAEDLAQYAGTYAGGAIRINLSASNGALHATMDGKTHVATPLGQGRFSVDGPLGYFVLVPGRDGSVRYLHSNLRSFARLQ
jgi:CubicO group peptidase (beta-lactamase class C family)